MRNASLLMLSLGLGPACVIDAPHYVVGDGGVPDARSGPDARIADAGVDADLSCTANEVICDDATSHYSECGPTGVIQFEMDCALGCAAAVEKCQDVDPSNGLAPYLDSAPEGLDVTFT